MRRTVGRRPTLLGFGRARPRLSAMGEHPFDIVTTVSAACGVHGAMAPGVAERERAIADLEERIASVVGVAADVGVAGSWRHPSGERWDMRRLHFNDPSPN